MSLVWRKKKRKKFYDWQIQNPQILIKLGEGERKSFVFVKGFTQQSTDPGVRMCRVSLLPPCRAMLSRTWRRTTHLAALAALQVAGLPPEMLLYLQ